MSRYVCRKELKRYADPKTIRSVLRQHDRGRTPRNIAFVELLPLLIISASRTGVKSS